MKKIGKILVFCVLFFLLTTGVAFSQTLEDLQDAVSLFSSQIAKSAALNSTMGLNWSNAYIGQFLNVPPHFGFGVTSGFTTLSAGSVNGLLGQFGAKPLNIGSIGIPLPGYTLEGRIGGFVYPFDLGLKIGFMSPDNAMNDLFGLGFDYFLIGGDFRYSLLPKWSPLKLSAGFGVNYMERGMSKTVPSGIPSFGFSDGANSYTLELTDPKIGIFWKTTSYEIKAQASFPLIVITPYAGVGLIYAKSNAGYSIKSDILVDGAAIDDDMKDILNGFGLSNITDTGFGSTKNNDAVNVRFFGGLSFNLTVLKFDLTGL
jgi:hypothetical protein